MSTINLLYKHSYDINDNISVMIPTVGQIIDNEDDYYGLVSAFTAMPIDFICQLDDAGIDFDSITEYDLFLLLFFSVASKDTSLLFGDLDLTKFKLAENEQNGMMVLYDEENDIVIDKGIHDQIASVLRRIHHLEKNNKRPANEDAKKFLIERTRQKMRRKSQKKESQLEPLITAMVNTEQFKYNYEGASNLTIYQFNESVRQIVKKTNYNNRMIGVYTGNIDVKSLGQDDFNWLNNK